MGRRLPCSLFFSYLSWNFYLMSPCGSRMVTQAVIPELKLLFLVSWREKSRVCVMNVSFMVLLFINSSLPMKVFVCRTKDEAEMAGHGHLMFCSVWMVCPVCLPVLYL